MLSDCTYLRIPLYAGAFSIFPYCMSPISPKRNNGEEEEEEEEEEGGGGGGGGAGGGAAAGVEEKLFM